MANIVSPAGDMGLSVSELGLTNGRIVTVGGKMGVWEAKIFFTPSEVRRLVLKALRPKFLLFAIRLPFLSDKRGRESETGSAE